MCTKYGTHTNAHEFLIDILCRWSLTNQNLLLHFTQFLLLLLHHLFAWLFFLSCVIIIIVFCIEWKRVSITTNEDKKVSVFCVYFDASSLVSRPNPSLSSSKPKLSLNKLQKALNSSARIDMTSYQFQCGGMMVELMKIRFISAVKRRKRKLIRTNAKIYYLLCDSIRRVKINGLIP